MLRFLVLLICCSGTLLGHGAPRPAPGLSVSNKIVLLEGRPYRGIGANYFSLFSRILADPADTSSLSNLTLLAGSGMPFVRFSCGGYWPSEQQLYVTNAAMFFSRLDKVVACAESNRIGLIPSLFWHVPTVCDLAGEPMQALGETNSRTSDLIRRYTRDVVKRYRNSPAIWAWEFGNEANLAVDLPNAAKHRPPIVPRLGTPAQRSSQDELRSSDMLTAYRVFAAAVREIDANRLLLTGNSVPRPHAWHNTHKGTWTADSLEQFQEILLRDNPEVFQSISIHVYPAASYPGDAKTPTELVRSAGDYARSQQRVLFVGEFGASREEGDLAAQQKAFSVLLDGLVQAKVPLAAFWVFDLPMQEKDWNCSFENDRRVFIEMTAAANRRMSQLSFNILY